MSKKNKRVREPELVLPTLKYMKNRPNGFARTSELIDHLEFKLNPGGKDASLNPDRGDTYFSQKVRNLVSHRKSTSSLVANGYAKYDSENHGLWITDEGRKLLRTLGK